MNRPRPRRQLHCSSARSPGEHCADRSLCHLRAPSLWRSRPTTPPGLRRPGRFTADEEAQFTVLSVLDAVSGSAYGTCHEDPELVERGLRTLARLRTAQRP
ncbi:hypothetical protein ACFVJM_39370 [Streptomyces virginiae]|uniref:hypothetical protein n=1 Tax=Streptomyces virginiae TaxID=1961 RepID=UPI003632D23B